MKTSRTVSIATTTVVALGVFLGGTSLLKSSEETGTPTRPVDTAASAVAGEGGVDNTPEELEEIATPADTTPPETGNETAEPESTPEKEQTTPAPETTSPPATQPTATTPATGTGAALPTTNPITIDGASLTLYMERNEVQASLFGLSPERVRTWVYSNTPGRDWVAEYKKLKQAILRSGARIVDDELEYTAEIGGGSITGYLNGLNFMVTVVDWQTISVSFIQR